MKEKTSKIAQSMQVDGDIVSSGDLIVEGELRGSFAGGNLIIGPSGRIVGEVKGGAIECAGHLEGHVEAASLKLTKGGCQAGTVVTEELAVESGAIIDCVLHSGTVDSTLVQPAEIRAKARKNVDLTRYLGAFKEGQRPCCFEVPWSERWEMYDHILDLLKKNKPLIQVVGDNGSGKTVLVEKLLTASLKNYTLLCLREKIGSVTLLLKEVAASLGLTGHEKLTARAQVLAQIRKELARRSENGERVVLLIDDAQEMFQATMEGVIRLLSGACGEEKVNPRQRLHIILFGTSDMSSTMVSIIREYFIDETNCQLSLEPLTMKDTADYLRLGLQVASQGEEAVAMSLLPNETIKKIHVHSNGSIAAINSLMDSALENTHRAGGDSITLE